MTIGNQRPRETKTMPTARFQPTDEEQQNVAILVSLGIPQEQICQMVRRKGKPIDIKTLRKHFKSEIERGDVTLKAKVGQFMVATIFGGPAPAGTVKIEKDECRTALLQLFLKTRCGFVDRHALEGGDPKRPIIYAPKGADQNL